MRAILRLYFGCFKKLFLAFNKRLNVLDVSIQSMFFLKKNVISKRKVKNKHLKPKNKFHSTLNKKQTNKHQLRGMPILNMFKKL